MTNGGVMKVQASPDFEKVMAEFSRDIQHIAREARALIYEILPQVVEVIWDHQKTVGYGTGPKKMSEHFCWMAPYKKHVVFGFYYGTELPDPEHVLEGTGKRMRHIKLYTIEDVRKPALRTLIQIATTHRVPPPKTR
jgi:hypothetical protein